MPTTRDLGWKQSFGLAVIAAVLSASASGPVQALEPGAGIKVTPVLKTSASWNGAPLAYPEGKPEITGQIVELQPQAETGWHRHPVPSFGLILQGELEVTLEDGKKKLIKAGESVAEVVGTLHNGKNTGNVPTRLVVFYAGAQDMPTTQKQTAPAEKPAAAPH